MTQDHSVAGDALHQLLRALPHQKITPETIDQRTIDHWYKREDRYRRLLSAVAEYHQAAEPGSRVCRCQLPDCPTALLVGGEAPPLASYIDAAVAEVRSGLAAVLREREADYRDRAMDAISRTRRDALMDVADAYLEAVDVLESSKPLQGGK